MDLNYIDRNGNPADTWNYVIKAAYLGRSYALYAANVACLALLVIVDRFDYPVCRDISQSLVPVASHQLVSTAVPCLLRKMTASHVKVTALSASQREPTPIEVWRKPGIRCPLIGNSDGR